VSSHRGRARPRYGRIAALATSVAVSVVAALAGLGLLATGSAPADAAQASAYAWTATVATDNADTTGGIGDTTGVGQPVPSSGLTPQAEQSGRQASHSATDSPTALPESSGSGRRVVFSQSRQRVWLMGDQPDDVQRTYLVSGSVTDNLQPGTYSVYSRSRHAVGVADSGVMGYFVRFTQGPTGAAIGFHTIPTQGGVPIQTKAQLGTPQSHGCIRQDLPDAVALWDFASVGTKVVVVA
jgi:hypothetical protein